MITEIKLQILNNIFGHLVVIPYEVFNNIYDHLLINLPDDHVKLIYFRNIFELCKCTWRSALGQARVGERARTGERTSQRPAKPSQTDQTKQNKNDRTEPYRCQPINRHHTLLPSYSYPLPSIQLHTQLTIISTLPN